MAYTYSRSLTIDSSKVGSTDQTDFPVAFFGTYDGTGGILDLRTVGNGGKVQNANGYDIAFFSDSGLTSALNFELVTYAAATGIVEFHVKVPTVSHTSSTVIYIAYGDSGISTYQGNTNGTWNSAFKGVYHLADGITLSMTDSTSNANTLTNNGTTTAIAGQIDGAASLNGSSQYLSTASGYLAANTTPFTVGGWAYPSSAGAGSKNIFASGNGVAGYSIQLRRDTADWNLYVTNGSIDVNATQAGGVSANTWKYIIGSCDGTNIMLYVNGSLIQTTSLGGLDRARNGPDSTWGADSNDGSLGQALWGGRLDELRISNVARGPDWILSEYNNQSNPDTFYTLGAEVAGISFDAASNSGYQAAQSTYTFNRTCSGINRYLTVDIAILSAGQTVTSVVDDNGGGNVTMTFLGARSTVTSFGRIESWGLVAPATGTKSIQVNLSSVVISTATAVSYNGVNQSFPVEGFNSNQATNVGAADATVSVTSVADNCWIHAAVATDDTAITAGQTTRNNVTGAGGSGADEDTGPISPATSTTMSYTAVGALATWTIAGYALRPIAASNLASTSNIQSFMLMGIGT